MMIGGRGGRSLCAGECKQLLEGFAGDGAPGLSQTSEAPDGPSKLMRVRPSKLIPRIKEEIFRRCLSRDSQCLLSARCWRVPTDQTGSRHPAKPHMEESLHLSICFQSASSALVMMAILMMRMILSQDLSELLEGLEIMCLIFLSWSKQPKMLTSTVWVFLP